MVLPRYRKTESLTRRTRRLAPRRFGMSFFAAGVALAAYGSDGETQEGAGVAAGSENGMELPAVIVTAERRPQSPQELPMSISTVNAAEIDNAKVGSLMEMQKLVPGLVITTSVTGHSEPIIRGIGTNIPGIGVENAVATYIDGVYQSRAIGETMQFMDVERIEVLKGPQGVLYGQNATGGAINIISKAPSHESEGRFDLQAGSHDQQVWRGTVSGPLSEGAVYGRLSFLSSSDDGDSKNALLKRRTNGSDVRGLRGVLELTPAKAFNLKFNASYYRSEFSPVAKPLHTDANPLITVFHATAIDDPRTVMHNEDAVVRLTNASFSATAEWFLDSMKLSSVTAFNKTDYQARHADLDGTEIPLARIGSPTSDAGVGMVSHFLSQEFSLASDEQAPLSWMALLSYQHEKAESSGWNLMSPLLHLSTNSIAAVKTDALALGGQATYALNDRLRVTAGARFNTEIKELDSLRVFTNGILTGSMSARERWSAATPKVVVDYSPRKDFMYYASVSKGFKSGGFNSLLAQPAFKPEKAVNYEVGLKSMWADGRVRANLALFHTRYDNMQVSVVMNNASILQTVVENAAKAVSRGVEAGVAARPSERIELSAAVQFLKARFVEFLSIDPRSPEQGTIDQKGNPLPRAPGVTASLAAQYAWPVLDGGDRMSLRLENYYRSKIYFTPFKNDYTSSPGVSIWNAVLSWEPLHGNGWYASAFVKNLTNQTYTLNVFDPQGLGYLAYFAPGRTLGAQLGYRY